MILLLLCCDNSHGVSSLSCSEASHGAVMISSRIAIAMDDFIGLNRAFDNVAHIQTMQQDQS